MLQPCWSYEHPRGLCWMIEGTAISAADYLLPLSISLIPERAFEAGSCAGIWSTSHEAVTCQQSRRFCIDIQ